MNFEKFIEDFNSAKDSNLDFVVVTLVDHQGSVPQIVGARLIANAGGYFSGTVGGGKLENAAIQKSKELINKNLTTELITWNLQTDLGMSCGGVVKLFFEVHKKSQIWTITVFGAGHVSQELIRLLLKLECSVTCIDSRKEWLDKLPIDLKLKTVQMNPMEDFVTKILDNSFIVCATMGHSTDFPILKKILTDLKTYPYVGAIGSDLKALKIKKELLDNNIIKNKIDRLFCPMGEPFGNNTPPEIALSIVSQLLKVRDQSYLKTM